MLLICASIYQCTCVSLAALLMVLKDILKLYNVSYPQLSQHNLENTLAEVIDLLGPGNLVRGGGPEYRLMWAASKVRQ